MNPKDFLTNHTSLSADEKVRAMVRVLTGPQGCPWDQKQTAKTIIDYVIDEAHELKSALETEDSEEIVGELGDLMFTTEFLRHSLAKEVSTQAASEQLVEKMVRRHPHVFGERDFDSENDLKKNWEAEKRKENRERKRLDQDIPASLPAMKKATKVLSRAANSGFRYDEEADAWDKISEEFHELEVALREEEERFEEEFGDLLLALLTLAKMKKCSPDKALNRAVTKLCDRLEATEAEAGKPLEEIPRSELKSYYLRGKAAGAPDSTAYFNYCGVSPWPREVRNTVRQACYRVGTQGLPAALEMLEERDALKEKIRRFCRAPEDSVVVLVQNVSTAALGVAFAQPWDGGGKLLLGKREFPANTVPWRQASKIFEAELLWFDEDLFRTDPEAALAELEATLSKHRPRVFALSAVSFWSGFRYPTEEIARLCRKYGTRLYLDAIQALGNTPFFWHEGLDYLGGGSHKSLLSPEGAGFLIVSAQAAKDWQPRLASWLSVENPVNFLMDGKWQSVPSQASPRPGDPTTLQGASLNSMGYAGLGAALDYLAERDVKSIFEKVQKLHDVLEPALEKLGWKSLRGESAGSRSAILSFAPPTGVDVTEVQRHLQENRISAGIPNGALRFGFHGFNEAPQVDYVIEVLTRLAAVGSPAQ